MDINDPECPLLVELKNVSKPEYYHTIHTAYLCSRIALQLKLDDAVVKACAYYHKIWLLKGENNWENAEQILTGNQIPLRVRELLKQYLSPAEQLVDREVIVLLFADTVISSIDYLFSKDKNVQLDYQKLIQTIYKRKMESGILDHSEISLGDLQKMKQILVDERLYYDFLRWKWKWYHIWFWYRGTGFAYWKPVFVLDVEGAETDAGDLGVHRGVAIQNLRFQIIQIDRKSVV